MLKMQLLLTSVGLFMLSFFTLAFLFINLPLRITFTLQILQVIYHVFGQNTQNEDQFCLSSSSNAVQTIEVTRKKIPSGVTAVHN